MVSQLHFIIAMTRIGQCSLEADLDVVADGALFQCVSSLADTIAILVDLGDLAAPGALGLGGRVIEDSLGIWERIAGVGRLSVPGVVLDETDLAVDNLAGTAGQRPLTDHCRLLVHGIDERAAPSGTTDVLDSDVVGVAVVALDVDRAADARSAIRARVAVAVLCCGAGLERRECSVNNVLSVLILARLEARVSDVLDAVEVELLGEIEAALVGGLGHVEGEGDVPQAISGGLGKTPVVANERKAQRWHAGHKNGGGGGDLHLVSNVEGFGGAGARVGWWRMLFV